MPEFCKTNNQWHCPAIRTWKETGLSSKQLKRTEVSQDSNGQVQVALQFNDEGTKLFADITTQCR